MNQKVEIFALWILSILSGLTAGSFGILFLWGFFALGDLFAILWLWLAFLSGTSAVKFKRIISEKENMNQLPKVEV
jgi:hypothetical protein